MFTGSQEWFRVCFVSYQLCKPWEYLKADIKETLKGVNKRIKRTIEHTLNTWREVLATKPYGRLSLEKG